MVRCWCLVVGDKKLGFAFEEPGSLLLKGQFYGGAALQYLWKRKV